LKDSKYDQDWDTQKMGSMSRQANANSSSIFSNEKLNNFEANCNGFILRGHTGAITCLSLCYDSFYFISGSSDCQIRLWTVRGGDCLAMFNMHMAPIWDVCLCPKGYFFASGGADKQVFLWCTNKSSPLRYFQGHTEEIVQVGFTKNMIYLISASRDHSLRIWKIKEPVMVRIFYASNILTR
jgi:WD40 repeat protein